MFKPPRKRTQRCHLQLQTVVPCCVKVYNRVTANSHRYTVLKSLQSLGAKISGSRALKPHTGVSHCSCACPKALNYAKIHRYSSGPLTAHSVSCQCVILGVAYSGIFPLRTGLRAACQRARISMINPFRPTPNGVGVPAQFLPRGGGKARQRTGVPACRRKATLEHHLHAEYMYARCKVSPQKKCCVPMAFVRGTLHFADESVLLVAHSDKTQAASAC